MKRLLSVFLVLILLLTAIPVASLAISQYGYVTGGWLRLRSGPSFDASTISSYYTGTEVKVVGSSGNWYQVETPDSKTGYMYASYITFSGGGGGSSAYVTSGNGYGVRMRSGPGTGYAIVGVYSVGTAVTVLQTGTSWSKIQIGSRVGYMMNKFLTTSGGGGGTGDPATIWSPNGYGVRLRTGPGTSYSTIGVYSVGTSVTILSHGSTWDRISVGSRTGYMMNYYLTQNTNTSVVTAFSFSASTATAMVTSAGGNLDITPTILGTNLTSPYFTLAVSSNASSYVTATRNASTGVIQIAIGSTIPDNTVFTVTGTTIDKASSGSALTATVTVTAVKTGTLSSITLLPVSSTINQTGSTVINARLVYTDGSYVNNAPISMYSLSITSGGTYASVSGNTLSGIAFSGTSDQTVTVKGTATANTSITSTCNITVKALTKPSAPTLVTAAAQSGQVALTWASPTDNGGSDVLGYKIYQSTTSTMGSTPITTITPGTVLTTTIGSLTNGTLYYFWVVAYNAQGDSPASNSMTATPGVTVPNAPTSLTVTSTSDQTIHLSWTAPTYNGGATLGDYRIYYGGSGYSTSSTTTKDLSGLTNGTTYSIFVVATNSVGESAHSNVVTAVPATAPSAPTGLTAVGGVSKATLSWAVPASNGSVINGYQVEYSTSSTFASDVHTATATTNSCVITITSGGPWYFRVTTTSVAHGNSTSPSDTVSATIQAEAPTFSPAAGAVTGSTSVTISSTTPSSTIYYTTDGSDPTTSSSTSQPVSVSSTTTIRAIAVSAGMTNSAIASATYTVSAAAPTFSPTAGTVTGSASVTISSTTPSSTIYYTTDGSDPTTSSSTTQPVSITQTTTIKAMAVASGLSNSSINSATYTVKAATPSLSPADGSSITTADTITLSSSEGSVSIYYTKDGSTPTTSSLPYSGPFTLDAGTVTVKCISVRTGCEPSDVASATYTVT